MGVIGQPPEIVQARLDLEHDGATRPALAPVRTTLRFVGLAVKVGRAVAAPARLHEDRAFVHEAHTVSLGGRAWREPA